jgi:hypothetical protein
MQNVIVFESGMRNYKHNNYEFDFTGITRGNVIHFTVTNNMLWRYENNYRKHFTRTLTKQGTISFNKYVYDVSKLSGISNVLAEMNNA